MRRMRERRKGQQAAPILYQIDDWQEFTNPATLPRKAGCDPDEIGRVVLKELTDNALDSGAASVTLDGDEHSVTVSDNGPGLDRATILRVFAVNRPLLSSKRRRLPTRGMLGNGLRVVMGAVAAHKGMISVTSRGLTYELAQNSVTGGTRVAAERGAPDMVGTQVALKFPEPLFDDAFYYARETIRVAGLGERYTGPSMPHWYSAESLVQLLAAAKDTPPERVVEDVFGIIDADARATLEWAADFIARHPPPRREEIGEIGERARLDGYHHKVTGHVTIDGAMIPYTVEAWAAANAIEKGEDNWDILFPFINGSPALVHLHHQADSQGLRLRGCGLDLKINGPKRALYDIDISVITPHLRLTGDGKAPYLGDFRDAIGSAVKGAATQAYRNLVRPAAEMSVVDAAYEVMEEAYLRASDDGTLPAKARQIMYAARPLILEMTGKATFSDSYFTQTLLPDYIRDCPEETARWDVVYDARGHLSEPHTERSVPLGTVAVRDYLGLRPGKPTRPHIATNDLYPTSGAENRYRNILFVEKEGFDELFEAVRLAERYDIAIMSTKGMSVVAARALLDHLAGSVHHIFVLHDFDVAGFSIFGTLGTDSRRYEFENDLSEQIIDLGLRLDDVVAMGLQSEPVDIKIQKRSAKRSTLHEHGATTKEILFLLPFSETCRRVELNAMTSRQLVDFIEAKFEYYGVDKVIPEPALLEQHMRHQLETQFANALIAEHAAEIAERAASMSVPADLTERVAALLEGEPELSWDQALSRIVTR
jgi:hypothetical protein